MLLVRGIRFPGIGGEHSRMFGANVGGLMLEEPGNAPQQQVLGCVDPFE